MRNWPFRTYDAKSQRPNAQIHCRESLPMPSRQAASRRSPCAPNTVPSSSTPNAGRFFDILTQCRTVPHSGEAGCASFPREG